MMANIFSKPVHVLVGLGFPRRITGPLDALMFLEDVPASGRNRAYFLVLKACKAAMIGEIEPDTARVAFEAYAKKQDILTTDTDDVVALRSLDGNSFHIS